MARVVNIEKMLKALGVEVTSRDGVELNAVCPNPDHDDTSPSWSIIDDPENERHGCHYCFACEFGGRPAKLVQARYGFSSLRASFEWLDRRDMYDDSPEPLAVSVTVKGRESESLAGETFSLPKGCAPKKPLDEWPSAPRRYVEGREITARQVSKWGITYATKGKFEDRIVIPIVDFDGVLQSAFARLYIKNDRAKYLNPVGKDALGPTFGEMFWPPEQFRKSKTVVVCEGALNALACERAGAVSIAALGGSNVDREHLRKLATFGEVVIVTDNDDSGNKAARKLRVLGRQTKVRRVILPSGLDANDIHVSQLAEAMALS